jgi:hypothetical protein
MLKYKFCRNYTGIIEDFPGIKHNTETKQIFDNIQDSLTPFKYNLNEIEGCYFMNHDKDDVQTIVNAWYTYNEISILWDYNKFLLKPSAYKNEIKINNYTIKTRNWLKITVDERK